jgi:hypothetical protein
VMQRDRAKIGSAFDALMAGAALPAETAIGPMIGPMGPNTASAASDDAAETFISSYFAQAAEGTRTLDLLHGKQC